MLICAYKKVAKKYVISSFKWMQRNVRRLRRVYSELFNCHVTDTVGQRY